MRGGDEWSYIYLRFASYSYPLSFVSGWKGGGLGYLLVKVKVVSCIYFTLYDGEKSWACSTTRCGREKRERGGRGGGMIPMLCVV